MTKTFSLVDGEVTLRAALRINYIADYYETSQHHLVCEEAILLGRSESLERRLKISPTEPDPEVTAEEEASLIFICSWLIGMESRSSCEWATGTSQGQHIDPGLICMLWAIFSSRMILYGDPLLIKEKPAFSSSSELVLEEMRSKIGVIACLC